MTARELHSLLQSPDAPRLIQVLPAEIHAAAHIPGSRNACVYEMTFPEQVCALVPDKSSAVVVYGAGEGTLDAVTAAEKLKAAGYARVQVFAGGLAEWEAAGLPLAGHGQLPRPPVLHGAFRLDASASVIRWTGRNLFNHHHGTVPLQSGEIILDQDRLVSARFTVEMTGIACEDISDPAMNALLIAHLHSDDFFAVAQHPAAEFIASSAERITAGTDGTPTHILRGAFTLRGISRPLEFPVLIAADDEGRRLTAQGQFELDRTAYGSHYGSGKLFRFLGRHLVNDCIHLHVKIHAAKA